MIPPRSFWIPLIALWIAWHLSAKKWFTGPKHTIDAAVVDAFKDS